MDSMDAPESLEKDECMWQSEIIINQVLLSVKRYHCLKQRKKSGDF